MANIVLSSPEFFAGGTGGASRVVGYESGRNRVARYSFTAPSTGATSVSLEFTDMWYGAGTQPKTLRFYIGTDANSHVNAGAGSTYTGVLNINTNGYTGYLGSANINLMPSGTYYLFVFPDSTTFGWYNWGGTATMTSGGAYGASTITSAGALTLGNSCNVKWTPVSVSFRYKLTFSLSGWSYTTGLIHPNTTAAYTYTGYVIPLDVASQIPNSAKGTMTVQLTSYDSNGSTQVGAVSTATFAVTVPDNSSTKPTVSMELSLVSDLAYPFDGFYIQNLTRVAADISASGKYGASISEKQMVIGNGVYSSPFESDVLTQTGDVTVTANATDSRGFTGKAEKSIYVIPYYKPTLIPASGESDIVCRRCDAIGTPSDSGTYLKIKAKRSYSPVVSDGEQFNSCLIRYRCNGGSWVTILAGDDESDEIDVAIPNVVVSTTAAYSIEVGVLDNLGYEASALIIVPSDKVEFNLREGGNGAAFGEYANEENVLAVAENWELKVKGKLTVREPQGDAEALNRGSADQRYMKLSGGKMVGDVDMDGNHITGLPSPTNDTDAVPKSYADRAKDYIVEQGTSGIWYYRKWNSGVCELFGRNPVLKYQDYSMRWSANYPFALKAIYSATATNNYAGGGGAYQWIYSLTTKVEATTTGCTVYCQNTLNVLSTQNSWAVSAVIVGTWK